MQLSSSNLTKTKYSYGDYNIYRSRGSDFYFIVHSEPMTETVIHHGKWKHILSLWNNHYNKDHASYKRSHLSLKESWIAALRSGKYTQGKGNLKTHEGKMCCLGVFCDVVDPNGWSDPQEGCAFSHGDSGHYRLSGGMRDKVGLEVLDVKTLITMNDTRFKNFDQIADHIEKNL